jgi:hypothetical protein
MKLPPLLMGCNSLDRSERHAELFAEVSQQYTFRTELSNSRGIIKGQLDAELRRDLDWLRLSDPMIAASLDFLIAHIVEVASEPQMTEARPSNSCHDIDAGVIVLRAARVITGMEHVQMGRRRAPGCNTPRESMRLDPIIVNGDSTIAGRVLRSEPLPASVPVRPLDAQPEAFQRSEARRQVATAQKVSPRANRQTTAATADRTGIINVHHGDLRGVAPACYQHDRGNFMSKFYHADQSERR